MALYLETETKSHVPLTYHRVVSVNTIHNNQNTIEVASYISKSTREEEETAITNGTAMDVYIDTQYIAAPYDPDMTLTDAYNWLKNNSETFSEAKDVLESDNSATAFAYSLSEGQIEKSDIPEDILSEVEAITVDDTKPAEKVGYILQKKVVPTKYMIIWDFVEDPNYDPNVPDGTYLKPYPYSVGDYVEQGMFYYNGEHTWEAIKSGVPANFEDTNYFEILTA